jgi:GNAT superfamily N-acetyltransferase
LQPAALGGLAPIVTVGQVGPERFDELRALCESVARELAREAVIRGDSMLCGEGVILVGLVDTATDRLVGFGRALSDGPLAIAVDLGLEPAYRGSGLGGRLFAELLRQAEAAGAETIELVASAELVRFYASYGFVASGGGSVMVRRAAS